MPSSTNLDKPSDTKLSIRGNDSGGKKKRQRTSLRTRIRLFFFMIADAVRGRYSRKAWRTVLALILGAAYIFWPFDFIPELPLAWFGLADDAAVFAACLQFVKKDLDAYHDWRQQKDSGTGS